MLKWRNIFQRILPLRIVPEQSLLCRQARSARDFFWPDEVYGTRGEASSLSTSTENHASSSCSPSTSIEVPTSDSGSTTFFDAASTSGNHRRRIKGGRRSIHYTDSARIAYQCYMRPRLSDLLNRPCYYREMAVYRNCDMA